MGKSEPKPTKTYPIKKKNRDDVSEFYNFIEKVERVEIECLVPHEYTIVGIDPGTRHLGVALFFDPSVCSSILYKFRLNREDTMMERIYTINNLFQHMAYREDLFATDDIAEVIIEGPAYVNVHRQVELAEQRAAIGIWFSQRSKLEWTEVLPKITVVQPNSIRKHVFGHGKVKAKEVWKEFPNDSSAALACALYALCEVNNGS